MIKKRSPCFTFKGVLYPSHPLFNPMTPFYHYSKPPNPNISATSQPYNSGRYLTAVSCPLFPVVLCLDRSVPSQSQYLTVQPSMSHHSAVPTVPCLTIPLFQPSHVTGPQPRPCQKTYPNTAVLSKKEGCQKKAVKKTDSELFHTV